MSLCAAALVGASFGEGGGHELQLSQPADRLERRFGHRHLGSAYQGRHRVGR
jgi:hypothetical protein